MEYQQLTEEYKHDVIAQAIYAREVEHFHYDLDRQNFTDMLKTMPDGDNKAMLQKRLDETNSRIGEVEAIYNALQKQITDPVEYEAAVSRTTAKREAV